MEEVRGGERQPNGDQQEMLNKRIHDLARMSERDPRDFEDVLDNADAAYALAHDAGMMRDEDGKEEPFVWPSVQRERLYQETLRNVLTPPVIVSKTYRGSQVSGEEYQELVNDAQLKYDPREMLKGTNYPVAILDDFNDNDSTGYGSHTITWYGCKNMDEATAYCEAVGWSHERPGPGDYDGEYTTRTIYENPYVLAERNANLGEADVVGVALATTELASRLGLVPQTAGIELGVVSDFSLEIAQWNETFRDSMLGAEGNRKTRAYLNPLYRKSLMQDVWRAANRDVKQGAIRIVQMLDVVSAQPFSRGDLAAITETTAGIVDALQTPHELRESTHISIEELLKSFMMMGRLRAEAAERGAVVGASGETKALVHSVEEVIAGTGRIAVESYIQSMQRKIDDKHFFA